MLKTIHLELSKINIQENLITSSKNKFHILGFLQRKKFFFAFLAGIGRVTTISATTCQVWSSGTSNYEIEHFCCKF